MRRCTLFFAAALLVGCRSCPPPPPDPVDAGNLCFEDSDCPDPSFFFCDTETQRCRGSCLEHVDCTAAVRGIHALAQCEQPGGLGCQCDQGACQLTLCSNDTDCDAQVCRDGRCVPPPSPSTVASCQVVPDLAVMRAGARVRFSVLAWDAAMNPVVLKEGISWTAHHPLVAGSGSAPGQDFTAAMVGAATGPVTAVQATAGPVNCFARVLVLPADIPPGQVAVAVWDEATGRPIAAASVLVSEPSTGQPLASPGLTDAQGVASLLLAGPTVTVTVFHPDFDYQTIAGYGLTSPSPDARLLAFPLRRNVFDRFGGVKGAFSFPATSNTHIGFVGAAQPYLHEFLPQAPDEPTHLVAFTIDSWVRTPTRLQLGFDRAHFNWGWSTLAPAGACRLEGGLFDEAAMAQGACGTSALWGFAADLSLGDLPLDSLSGGSTKVDWLRVLRRMVPTFRKFNSVVARDVGYARSPPTLGPGGVPDVSDTSAFPVHPLPFGQLPLAFSMVLRVPEVPIIDGQRSDMVLARGFAWVPGRGLVQLGLGAAVRTAYGSTRTDQQDLLPSSGMMSVRMAPTHHGIEGAEYILLATAIDSRQMPSPETFSGVVARVPQNRLIFDPLGAAPVEPPPFLKLPSGARYNFTTTPRGNLAPRSFLFASDPGLLEATELRVIFGDRQQRRWVVRLDPAQADAGFTLPSAPGTFSDRTSWDGSSRSTMRVQALALDDGKKVGFTRLAELDSTNADRLTELTTAFSVADYGRPTVQWRVPAASGATLPRGASTRVLVTHFKIGSASIDDGWVRLTFQGGSGCTEAEAHSDASGWGDIALEVPLGCTGTNVQLTASLYDNAGEALGITASITVDIP